MTDANQNYDPTRDPTPEDIRAERRRMITPGFWVSLLKGREPLGETFWGGNLLSALLLAPVFIVILLFVAPVAPAAAAGIFTVISALYGLFLLGVARAVAVARPRPGAKAPRVLRIAGVVVTLLSALYLIGLAVLPAVG